jgi:hypothetical protein
VDFGTLANNFLSACGSKSQPSVGEVIQILLADPRKFYELAGGRDKYAYDCLAGPAELMFDSYSFLVELRNIAVNARSISSSTKMKLRKAPVLLGLQRTLHSRASLDLHEKRSLTDSIEEVDDDDDAWEIQYDLKRPDQIVIADDNNMYQVFGDSIFTAPQEDILEGASHRLSETAVLKLYCWMDNRFLPTAGFKATHHSREGRV